MITINNNFMDVKFYTREDLPEDIAGDVNATKSFLNLAGNILAPSQVHGKNIIAPDEKEKNILPARPEADGVYLSDLNFTVMMRYADCAPVIIYPDENWAKENYKFVVVLHSGFRGTVLNIVDEAVKKFNIPAQICSAWIGPCVGFEDYSRFNDEWTQKGLDVFHDKNLRVQDRFYFFDIAGEITSQLKNCGIPEQNILNSNINTFRDLKCYSYRRGDKLARMALVAKLI